MNKNLTVSTTKNTFNPSVIVSQERREDIREAIELVNETIKQSFEKVNLQSSDANHQDFGPTDIATHFGYNEN